MTATHARMRFPDKEEAAGSSPARPTHETGSFDPHQNGPCVTGASEGQTSSRHRLPADLHGRPETAPRSHDTHTNVARRRALTAFAVALFALGVWLLSGIELAPPAQDVIYQPGVIVHGTPAPGSTDPAPTPSPSPTTPKEVTRYVV